MELLLIRHSITAGNEKKQYIGATDQPLSEAGRQLAQTKRYPKPEKLWVSPMLRCRQTAELLFPDVTQVVVPELRECDFGTFEGKTWEQLREEPVYQAWMDGDRSITFPEGESLTSFFARCHKGMEWVTEQAQGIGFGAVVTHGGTIMAILERYGVPKAPFYHWQVGNCGGFRVQVEPPLQLNSLEKFS